MSTSKYGRYSFYELATFAADVPVAATQETHLPVLDRPLPKLDQATDQAQESDNDGMQSPDIATVQSGALSFQTRIYTGTKKWDGGGTYPTSFYLKPLLDNYFGMSGGSTFVGTTVASGGPGHSVAVVLTDATNLTVGAALMFYPAAGGAPEVRFATAKSSNTVTLDSDLSIAASYAVGAKVCAGFNYEPTLGGYAKYLAINAELGSVSRMLSHGWIGGLKLQGLAAKQGARWAFDYVASRWSAGVTPSDSAAYPYNVYGANPCLVTKGAPVTIDETDINCLELSVDFGCKNEEITATGGTNGCQGRELVEYAPSVDFTTYFSAALEAKYISRATADMRIVIPVGTTDTTQNIGTMALYFPSIQVQTEHASVNGQECTKVKATGVRMTAASRIAGVDKPMFLTIFGGA